MKEIIRFPIERTSAHKKARLETMVAAFCKRARFDRATTRRVLAQTDAP